MRLLLFSIVAICIAGSRNQEIAIGTEYLRAHFNSTLLSESAINAQNGDDNSPPVNPDDSPESGTTSTATAAAAQSGDGNSPTHEHEHDHEHKIHHEHDAKVTIDFHNIVDIIKQQLHESEQRLLSAIHHEHQHATSSPAAVVLKSYRIADREK